MALRTGSGVVNLVRKMRADFCLCGQRRGLYFLRHRIKGFQYVRELIRVESSQRVRDAHIWRRAIKRVLGIYIHKP